ncbi:MAG: hypothetical protein GX236_08440 [Clostridiaceae bacterium]|jgi:hypothetical protein|nr:hypothetical protein [Clostridiaceae bacterium]
MTNSIALNNGSFLDLTHDEKMQTSGGDTWDAIKEAWTALPQPLKPIIIVAVVSYAVWEAGQSVGKPLGRFIYNVTH